ncbi:MAG: Glutamate--cysteine ligase (EC [uncultured Thiotrichaceae bacterium]|uniref:Glutamate--cysteine ligase n=1 Tax=uncultured Thiotrichaceae bacterium TaxID=298394 RepID=A0A6S6TFD4_9GAMM|nr:MAG: Glutamate--cysteine ligase (EC [uncultured Thiotrichaceae bacterium]
MYQELQQCLHKIEADNLYEYLRESRTGLEKESLRVNPDGYISQTSHPAVLGSALTHPWITTDYAESLMELITPPQKRATDALDFLLNVETFVYQQLQDDELLWTTSMPCIIGGEDDIRIAEYGESNAGKMKHAYRQGLAWRYGKIMQVIAGVHFNYSVSEDFWPVWHAMEANTQNSSNPQSLREFRDTRYMGQTRNIQRFGWLIIYLFGTSPAICKSFLDGKAPSETMKDFNQHTIYEPYGTSLRMGNIGYTNSKSHETGIHVCYDTVESYTRSLRCAISKPYADYEKIGVKVNGEYRQLNANILQIENEYYSTVRPKQVLQGFEQPVDALFDRGIRYVELRSVDVNAFHPAGMTNTQLSFLEVFMHFCLLKDSELLDADAKRRIDNNQYLVAHRGRDPQLRLDRRGESILLKEWAPELLENMLPVAAMLDKTHNDSRYTAAVQTQLQLAENPDLTPSAQALEDMANHGQEDFFSFAQRKSKEHRQFFMQRELSQELQKEFEAMATSSIAEQQRIEAADELDFDTFLARYFEGGLD